MSAKHTCCWVKGDNAPCGKPTTYRVVRDDDGNRVRMYDSLCPAHRKVADASLDEQDEDTKGDTSHE